MMWAAPPEPDEDSLYACVLIFVVGLATAIGGIWLLGAFK
jgi:hypothetical protein